MALLELYFHTQTLNTPPKISGYCGGGARKGAFHNGARRRHRGGKTLRKEREGCEAVKVSPSAGGASLRVSVRK